ncbi:hypothetical protein [Ideonella sp.]|uniref:hypothetical protein n=1 Tax=Ideonella sp. TaxID=1929293 RepID=UPI003BB49C5A
MFAFLVILTALLALNVWATRRVLFAPAEWGVPKRMLLAGIWIMPFMGALFAAMHMPAPSSGDGLPATDTTTDQPEAPAQLSGSGSVGFDVREHLTFANGVPILDWRALAEWAEQGHPPETTATSVDQGRRAWLLHMRDAMASGAQVHTSDDAYILSTLEPRIVEATARYISTARQRVSRVLGELAQIPRNERSILIVFDSEEDYYHYVSIYYPSEGEFAFSGGMYIHAGCPHFVVVRADLSNIEPVIAHELTHSALAHLELPKWLDEGLAVNTEHRVAGANRLRHTPHELHHMHQRFWNAERIQEFWSGASFDRTDDGNLLSYELARIIVEQMAKQWQAFASFAGSASREDSGARAARSILNIRLGAYAAALLEMEPGESWEPDSGSASISSDA